MITCFYDDSMVTDMWKIGNCQKAIRKYKSLKILKFKALLLVSHSKLWLVIRL